MIKYASNVFGAIKVSFGNMICDVCSGLKTSAGPEVNYENVRDALGADPRIGPAWLDVNHGSYRGFGGYCFPKDLKAFTEFCKSLVKPLRVSENKRLFGLRKFLESVWDYNDRLLGIQNLTVEDVSKHDKEIILAKRKIIE